MRLVSAPEEAIKGLNQYTEKVSRHEQVRIATGSGYFFKWGPRTVRQIVGYLG